MKKISHNNTYQTSDGQRYSKFIIDINIRKAKAEKLRIQKEEHGYNFCEKCKQNDCIPLDCSHNISVKEAKETGQSELCWDLNNIEILGRKCHQEKDGLNLKFKNL